MQKSVLFFAIVTLFVVSNLTKSHLSEHLRADASIGPYIHAAAIKRRANHVRPCSAKGFRLFLGNTAQFPPYGLSTASAAAARHLRCQNAR